ncbi:hypothetical protein BDQ12DRAFT_731934 [Crucibulum laeve]|uniref:Fungal-type protein kinase domain-containing protein n=1 Tax=Crucibulum laeve TaxID=68775 RepID=A0A5C3MFH3_9AGAR|nr:hypothetical protein BDQ12DRAFT_731934 [Crucibulum laeve]
MASDIRKGIIRDLTHNTRLANTEVFFNKLLPVPPETIENIKKTCSDQGLLGDNGWSKFPNVNDEQKKFGEDLFYPAFVEAAEHIRKTALELQGPKVAQKLINTCWIDRHSRPPKSLKSEDIPASIRPDVLNVTGSKDIEKKIIALEKLIREKYEQKESDSSDTTKVKKLEKVLAANKLLAIWWAQLHVAVEVKESSDDAYLEDSVIQLCTYLREMLRQQPDRRFVLGIILSGYKLTVWLCDRSGLLGTARAIDIHDSPHCFIQVIAGLALLEPHRLGWDPTMRLYIPATPDHSERFLPSYEYEFHVSADKLLHYQTHWAIDMPSDNDRSNRVCFITLQTVAAAAAEVMCGRATLVWEAILHTEKDNLSPGIYIIKQCWRARNHTISEGEVYDIPQLFHNPEDPNPRLTNRKYSSEDVMIGEHLDTTLDLIRQGITPEHVSPAPLEKKRQRPEDHEPLLHTKSTNATDIHTTVAYADIEPVLRGLSRVALKIWGWPIKFFRDIPELLRILRDAIADHYLLILNGVLHRDISPSNIIISPITPSVVKTRGYLIDFDHIKQSQDYHTVEEIVERQNPCSAVEKQTTPEGVQTAISALHGLSIDRDVAVVALKACSQQGGRAAMYIYETVKAIHKITKKGTTYTSEDLRWNELNMKPLPTFEDHQPRQGTRTGTLPFMSPEVIACDTLYQGLTWKPRNFGNFIHQGIHDMDSVLSILNFICITRGGPGGDRREELISKYDDVLSDDSEDFKRIKELRNLVRKLFDIDDPAELRNTKWRFFRNPALMDAEVFGSFHPNFEALKPLARNWYTTLRHAYEFSRYEYYDIHRHFLATLDEFIQNFEENSPTLTPEFLQAKHAVDRKRQDYLKKRLSMFKLEEEPLPTDVEEDRVPVQLEETQSPLSRRKRRKVRAGEENKGEAGGNKRLDSSNYTSLLQVCEE